MSQRQLYLAAYDISSPHRLHSMLKVIREYSTGGQKSAYECFLTENERALLLESVVALMDKEEDRFFLLRLDPRSTVGTLGIAVRPIDPHYFYIG